MRTEFQIAILVGMVAALAGCITPDQLKAQSAGQTGCAPAAIDVSTPQGVTGGYMWNATCNGKKYLCTAISSGKNSDQVSCAVAAP
jgi:hypothetical protein